MSLAEFQFTTEELDCLNNVQFFRTKRKAQQKLFKLLTETHQQLSSSIPAADFPTPTDEGKISRGENYNGLPYLILDYPKHFTRENSLAFRTLAWWGHDFCCSLLLFGQVWDSKREKLIGQLPALAEANCWLAAGHSPWEHHPAAGNHQPLQQTTQLGFLHQQNFFKISRTLPLEKAAQLPEFALESWKLFSKLIK